jgi:hypothetical protein
LPLVGLIVSAAITAEFPQGYNLPYFIFGRTKVKLEFFFEKISHKKYGEDSHKDHGEREDHKEGIRGFCMLSYRDLSI